MSKSKKKKSQATSKEPRTKGHSTSHMDGAVDGSTAESSGSMVPRVPPQSQPNEERNVMSEEERKAFLADIVRQAKNFRTDIESQIAELEAILNDYDPFDIIGHVWWANAIHNPNTYKEYAHHGNDAHTEYAALLYLTRPYHESNERLVPGLIIEIINNKIDNLFRLVVMNLTLGDIDPERDGPPDPLMELRWNTLNRSILVRYPGYRHHLEHALRGIFLPLDNQLERILGFTTEDALAAISGINTMLSRRINERRDQAREGLKGQLHDLKRYRKKNRAEGSELGQDVLQQLAGLKPSDAKRQLFNASTAWLFFAFGETLLFTSADLASETGRPVERIESYLKSMSLEFDTVDVRYRVPAPTHPLMSHPLIRHGGHYFCPVVNSLPWNLRAGVEEYLNPQSPTAATGATEQVWQQYQAARADYVETRAMELLKRIMPHAATYQNLTYDIVVDGNAGKAELDGLILLDSALFILECKAGGMSPSARRGGHKRMIEDLKELVGEAYSQALRAKAYIQSSNTPEFQLRDGTTVKIDKTKLDKIFLITVTLEPLDAFVTTLYQLEDLGLFSKDDLPWCVALLDLEVIADMIESPGEFVHYLLRRYKISQERRVTAHEELDWFGCYLSQGLYFEDAFSDGGPDRIYLTTYTTDFDDYYMTVLGERTKPAPKPRQPMPDVFRQIVIEIEKLRPEECLDATLALLEMSMKSRTEFANQAQLRRRLAIRDGEVHDFSLGFSASSLGITYMIAPGEKRDELYRKLEVFCKMKKYQTKFERWLGIGCLVDKEGWVHVVGFLKGSWEYDQMIDEIVSEALPPLLGGE
jgi:hypothetical protein